MIAIDRRLSVDHGLGGKRKMIPRRMKYIDQNRDDEDGESKG